jgi:DNA-binding transcriptional MerR regulator
MMEFTIGQLAKRADVKVPTIRYYEQIGLMAEPARSDGKQRRYGSQDVKRLSFIRHARELGFDISDIRQLLSLAAKPQASCHEADGIAQRHLEEVDLRIGKLKALRAELKRMVAECGHGRVCDCRIIEVIADHTKCEHDRH